MAAESTTEQKIPMDEWRPPWGDDPFSILPLYSGREQEGHDEEDEYA